MPVISFSMEEHSRLVLNNPLTNISSHSHFMGKKMITRNIVMKGDDDSEADEYGSHLMMTGK